MRLECLKDDESDTELGIGVEYGILEYLVAAADLVYSTEAKGAFIGLSLGADFALLEKSLIISPYLMQAIDIEYASIDHRSFNNFELGMTVLYELSERMSLIGRIH